MHAKDANTTKKVLAYTTGDIIVYEIVPKANRAIVSVGRRSMEMGF
jgi:hypothetical protein